MYKKVRATKSIAEHYNEQLLAEGVIREKAVNSWKKVLWDKAEEAFQLAKTEKPKMSDLTDPQYQGLRSMTHKWSDMKFSHLGDEPTSTGYDIQALKDIATASVEYPDHI